MTRRRLKLSKAMKARLWRLARRSVYVAFGLLAASVVWTAAYVVVEPPTTITILQRAAAGADVRRRPIALEYVSPHLVRAVIAAEDTRFCVHDGFDTEAIRAALADARRGAGLRGASTISQQTAKNAFLWTGGGFARKAAEAWFTLWAEALWSKRRTMEIYLNAAEWGDGIFGAEAAAQARFGKSAAHLTPREAALLAAVLPSPNKWRLDPPGPYVTSRAATIEARMGVVRRDALARCVLRNS